MLPSPDAPVVETPDKRSVLRRWRRDPSGTTAIEFAFVATPFLMLLFGIMGVGLYFFTTFSLENAVEQTGRLIRTGQVQQGGMTAQQFKDQVCSLAPSFVDCTNKIRVNVLNYPDSEAIGPSTLPQCLDAAGNLSSVTSFAPGDADQVVLIWVCYEWSLASKIPYLNLGNMANGSRLIQAATTFRTEPYN
ncbi:MAG: TadE/TadG family type IV pilus assembly protein [Hyphomicrobiaceae bacterium]